MLFVAVHEFKIRVDSLCHLRARARRAPPAGRAACAACWPPAPIPFLLNPVGAMVRSAAAVERQPSYGVAVRDTAIAPARRWVCAVLSL